MVCKACPFAFTDESEQVQNYGCLPTPFDIIKMKRESGHNWSCHESEGKKLCQGFKQHVKKAQEHKYMDDLSDIDTSKGGLINYETWYDKGPEEATREAGENQ